MTKFQPIEMITQKRSFSDKFSSFVMKFGHMIEILVVIGIWTFFFSGHTDLGGFTRNEMLTYIIAGGFISLLTGTLLYRLIERDLYQDRSKLLMYRPFRYLRYILVDGFSIFLAPFLLGLVGQALVLYFLMDYFIVNLDYAYLSVIVLMAILSYVIEFLLAYLLHLYFITYFEKSDVLAVLIRFKKIIAGNYFPLSFLPVVFVQISLFFPFAYSFFVPAQLYLKNIELKAGMLGLFVQIVWILIMYASIRVMWQKRLKLLSSHT